MRYEYAGERRIRERNKKIYRVAHWPIWIWVFFLAPGPLTFDLFEHGPSARNIAWLFVVIIGTGIAGLFGQLPGVEPKPYILRFTEDKPNPLYRRICYTFAWSDVIAFALLNLAGLVIAAVTGGWYLKQIYVYAYFPIYIIVLALGATGVLPRVRRSTKGSVWAVTLAQALLMVLWKVLPRTHSADIVKLAVYLISLVLLGLSARSGLLPRTRPILPGELMVAD
jgi:hypothetical protein